MTDGFLIPASVCLCVVTETVMASYGMSSKGPDSLSLCDPANMCVPFCGAGEVALWKEHWIGRQETWHLPLTDLEVHLGLCRKELTLAVFCEFCHPLWILILLFIHILLP